MRILLAAVNAKYIHSNLAVYSLRASAGKYASLLEIAEYTINHRQEEIFRGIYKKRPQLLFLSCYIWNRDMLLALAEDLRKVLPDLRIWIGGPEVSYDAAEFLSAYPQFDGVMQGEGELTFRQLLACYVDGIGTLGDIGGIAYRRDTAERWEERTQEKIREHWRDGTQERNEGCGKDCAQEKNVGCGKEHTQEKNGNYAAVPLRNGDAGIPEICVNAPQLPARTLDEFPFAYTDLDDFAHRIIYYESSRGCPFGCSYCLSSIDRHVRYRSMELVEAELTFFLEHRVPLVKFVDRTFNANHARTLRLWQFLKDHDNEITTFHFELAADLLSEEELELLAGMRPGQVRLEIGVQTTNRRTLEAIHRTAEFEEIARRVRRISSAGNVCQHLDLIAGLPYEDYESFGHSFDAVYRLHPQELQLGFLKVLKGSEMHRRAREYGLVYRSLPPYEVLETRWLSCDALIRLKEIEEMLESCYNSGQFRNTMLALEKLMGRPFALYEALADYDREVRMPGQQYSRAQQFAFLRGFIRQKLRIPESERLRLDELLTLDCYLRENAKTRPDWAADLKIYKERMIDFYRREEQERIYLPDYPEWTWKQLMRATHLECFRHLKAQEVSASSACRAGEAVSAGDAGNQELWVLFDYRNRNPVTQDAEICILENI